MIRRAFDKSQHDSVEKVFSVDPLDIIDSVINLNDCESVIGDANKYYCGKNVDTCKSCCNGNCGPTNGCNCRACMLIDVTKRMLKPGFLVNSKGRNCRVSKSNGLV